jgi:CNT family concentrative nucleoside transporter
MELTRRDQSGTKKRHHPVVISILVLEARAYMLLQGLGGILLFLGAAWLLSEDRARVPWRTVAGGVVLQVSLAVTLLALPASRELFLYLNEVLLLVEKATRAGTSFVFGYLGGGPLPFEESSAGASFVLAFQALPLVLVVSALSSLLFYWRILPLVVKGFAFLLERTLGIGGVVGVGAAANVFVGMVEAPLLVRPYLAALTRGELFILMSCGMATIAGTVMVLYASIISPIIPDAMGHILAASLLNAPAAITIAVLMVPPGNQGTAGEMLPPVQASSSMDAVTQGTLQGVSLLLNIIAMLIVLVALVGLVNQFLGLLPHWNGNPITLQRLLGYGMAPVAWCMGIPWAEAGTAGTLMGTKIVLNELLAYLEMAALPDTALRQESRVIMTYGMCGFANLGSLGILIGGLGTMVPEKRKEVVELGFRSILAGTLASCMTAAVVGVIL